MIPKSTLWWINRRTLIKAGHESPNIASWSKLITNKMGVKRKQKVGSSVTKF